MTAINIRVAFVGRCRIATVAQHDACPTERIKQERKQSQQQLSPSRQFGKIGLFLSQGAIQRFVDLAKGGSKLAQKRRANSNALTRAEANGSDYIWRARVQNCRQRLQAHAGHYRPGVFQALLEPVPFQPAVQEVFWRGAVASSG